MKKKLAVFDRALGFRPDLFSAALLVVRVQFEKRLGNYAVSSDILAGTSRMEQLP